ncbi:hypothetical protein Tco_0591562 [Tanacetum coccineum]
MASSGSYKKLVPKYIKFIVLEKISECKRSINCIVGEIHNATSHLEHLNGMIEMLEGVHFTLEIYDNVWCLREMVKSGNKKLLDLKKHLVVAEEDIRGLKLIHTDNDVHSFFADAERRGKIHLYVTHKKQALGKFYLKNMVWLEEDASLRCSSLSPFSTRIKRKSHKTTKECGRKNSRGKEKMVDDEPLGRKLLKTSRKGKEKMDEFPDSTPIKERKYCDDRVGRMSMQTFLNELGEFPDLTPTKEREVDDEAVGRNSIRTRRKGKEIMAEFSGTPANEKKVVVTNYRRAIINGKAKMVEVADVQESNVKVWIYQKLQENIQKRASMDTRIRRVQKEAIDSKPKPEKSSLSQRWSN